MVSPPLSASSQAVLLSFGPLLSVFPVGGCMRCLSHAHPYGLVLWLPVSAFVPGCVRPFFQRSSRLPFAALPLVSVLAPAWDFSVTMGCFLVPAAGSLFRSLVVRGRFCRLFFLLSRLAILLTVVSASSFSVPRLCPALPFFSLFPCSFWWCPSPPRPFRLPAVLLEHCGAVLASA